MKKICGLLFIQVGFMMSAFADECDTAIDTLEKINHEILITTQLIGDMRAVRGEFGKLAREERIREYEASLKGSEEYRTKFRESVRNFCSNGRIGEDAHLLTKFYLQSTLAAASPAEKLISKLKSEGFQAMDRYAFAVIHRSCPEKTCDKTYLVSRIYKKGNKERAVPLVVQMTSDAMKLAESETSKLLDIFSE